MTRMGTDPGESDFSLRSYQFELPDSLIAQEPAQNRSDSRCIFAFRGEKQRHLGNFSEMVDRLHGDELLVYNDTRVIPARIRAQRATGGKVEIFLLRPCQELPQAGGAGDQCGCTLRLVQQGLSERARAGS